MATKNITDSVLEQYEKANQPSGNRMSQEEKMKKYFAAVLTQNQSEATKRIRILPTKDGGTPFKEGWFHEIQVDGKWVKYYDPGKNDGEYSPLTNVYETLMETGKKSDEELAKQYKPRLFYIVKVIDRDNEQDGVKFWRFKHNYKKEGILDKIIPIWKAKGNLTDALTGRDLIIQLGKAKTPKGKEYTVIQSIMYEDAGPLHTEEKIMEEWLADELEWKDVYSKKPTEYLEAIARGETPKWDSNLGKYVYGEEASAMKFGNANTEISDPQADDEPNEDLPF